MKSINETSLDLMKSLQSHINDVENGKQVEIGDLNYSYELNIVLGRFNDMQKTSLLPCFNGKYNINQDSFDYYMKELTKQYGLKLIKDDYFPNDWVVSDGIKKHKCIFYITGSDNSINGVDVNHIDITFFSYSIQMLVYSFSGLDSVLFGIKSGEIFEGFDQKY